jgi:hypothetical protein
MTHPLIENYVKRGENWKLGAISLGMDIEEAKAIMQEYRDSKSIGFVDTLDNKIDLVINSIDNSVEEASMGDMARMIDVLYKIKRLETGKSTENMGVALKVLQEYGN